MTGLLAKMEALGRYTLPPCTTKRRTTTNLKTTPNQNCQKIELYKVQQGVKEETFIQTGRRDRDRQLGQRGHIARQQLEDQVVPHLCADKAGGTIREQDRPCNPGFQCGEIKPQNL